MLHDSQGDGRFVELREGDRLLVGAPTREARLSALEILLGRHLYTAIYE